MKEILQDLTATGIACGVLFLKELYIIIKRFSKQYPIKKEKKKKYNELYNHHIKLIKENPDNTEYRLNMYLLLEKAEKDKIKIKKEKI